MGKCKTPAQADAELDEWIKTSIGVAFLGPWLAQCARYTQDTAMGIYRKARYVGHGTGNARDIIDNCDKAYFDVIWNNPGDPGLTPQRGDVIIWDGVPMWDGKKYGHIAVVAASTRESVTVVQQDGAAPPTRQVGEYRYSIKPAHLATLPYWGPTLGSVRGWIRPKWSMVAYTGADKRGHGTVTAPAAPSHDVLDWIDVSDWQPTTVIRDVPTDAVVIKASEGVGFRAKNLDGHVKAAVKKGIPFMLYHFARGSVNSSEAEVAHFRAVVAPYLKQPLCAGLVLDFEEDAIMHYGAWGEDFLAQLRRELPGVPLALYTRAAFLRAKGWSATTKARTPVWLAAYGTDQRMDGYADNFAGAPTVPGWHIAAWQYSQRGRLKGYAGDLDLNRTLPGAVPMWPSRVAKITSTKKELDMTPAELRKIIREEIPKILIDSPEKGGKKMTLAEHWRWQRDDRGKQVQFRKDVSEKFAALAKSASSIIDRLTTKEK